MCGKVVVSSIRYLFLGRLYTESPNFYHSFFLKFSDNRDTVLKGRVVVREESDTPYG